MASKQQTPDLKRKSKGQPALAPIARYTPTPGQSGATKGKAEASSSQAVAVPAASVNDSSSNPNTGASVPLPPNISSSASTATLHTPETKAEPPESAMSTPIMTKAKTEGKGKGKSKAKVEDKEEGEISDIEEVAPPKPAMLPVATTSSLTATGAAPVPPIAPRTPSLRPPPTNQPAHPTNVPARKQKDHISSYRPNAALFSTPASAAPASSQPRPHPNRSGAMPAGIVPARPQTPASTAPVATRPAPAGPSAQAPPSVVPRTLPHEPMNKYEREAAGLPPIKAVDQAKKKGKKNKTTRVASLGAGQAVSPASSVRSRSSSTAASPTAMASSVRPTTHAGTGSAGPSAITRPAFAAAVKQEPGSTSSSTALSSKLTDALRARICAAPADITPEGAREYMDNLRRLIDDHKLTGNDLILGGATRKYISAVCEEILIDSEERKSREPEQSGTEKEGSAGPDPNASSDQLDHGTARTLVDGMDVDGMDEDFDVGVQVASGDMYRTLSAHTDSSEERQVERMMPVAFASPDRPRVPPPMQYPAGPAPPPLIHPQPQPIGRRMAASSSWAPTPPTGPRAVPLGQGGQATPTRLNGAAPVFLPTLSFPPPPPSHLPPPAPTSSTSSGTAASAVKVESYRPNSAAALRAKLMSASADSPASSSPVHAVRPVIGLSLPAKPAAPLAPLAASSPSSASAPARPPARDMTATLQARTAMMEARRKAMESLKAKRAQVRTETLNEPATVTVATTSTSSSAAGPSSGTSDTPIEIPEDAPAKTPDHEIPIDEISADIDAELARMNEKLEGMEKEEKVLQDEVEHSQEPGLILNQGEGKAVMDVDVDMEAEEGEISDDTPPPPTRPRTPTAVIASIATVGATKRKRPGAMDLDEKPIAAQVRSIQKRRFAIPITAQKWSMQLADEEESDTEVELERKIRIATAVPATIVIPEPYDPAKELAKKNEGIRQLKAKIERRRRHKEQAAKGQRATLSTAASLSAAVVQQSVGAVENEGPADDAEEKADDNSAMDVDMPTVHVDEDVPKEKADGQVQGSIETPTSRFQAYEPILPHYPRLTRKAAVSSETISPQDNGGNSSNSLDASARANPDMVICAAEMGGTCADTECEDLHLARFSMSEDDMVEYAAHQFPKISANSVRVVVQQIVQSVRAKAKKSGVSSAANASSSSKPSSSSSLPSSSAVSAATPAGAQLEREHLMQALAQVVSLLASMPAPAKASAARA